ncbi:hypothetical protein ABI_10390 [Asticcacaulis biprosthecium C19]|uniref:Uncharacterized protein n=1 Tax=Asticcacaulis biprosthecium C19 TaxID=715226 RepID=F4QH65_9CAUL|nr:hypothetical protein ABI_10390 [Asticcacaulis biprosthecium C19]
MVDPEIGEINHHFPFSITICHTTDLKTFDNTLISWCKSCR